MRLLLQSVLNALLSAHADAVVGAEWGRPSPTRTARRNDYRHRDLDTRVGTIDVSILRLPTGTYFPGRLLERRQRAESTLPCNMAQACRTRAEPQGGGRLGSVPVSVAGTGTGGTA